jgi:hypothetical protein
MFLYANNLEEVTINELIPPLARAVLAAATLGVVAGILLRDLRRGALIASGLVVLWFGFGHLADVIKPLAVGDNIQVLGWTVFLGVVFLAAVVLRRRWMARMTSALNVVSFVLVAIVTIQILPYQVTKASIPSDPPAAAVKAPAGARDIYYFIWDDYGSTRAIETLAGVHNDLPDWLSSRGFYVAANSHSNYVRTTLSLAADLNMQSLSPIAERMGAANGNLQPVYDLIQNNAAGRFLKAHGYRYIHMGSWFNPTQSVAIADENYHLDSTTNFEAILDGTTFHPELNQLLRVPVLPEHDAVHRDNALYEFATLPTIQAEPGPKFVFVQILLPHLPDVFKPDGSYPSAEEQKTRTESQAISDQLTYTNEHVRQIIDRLLAAPPDKQPIIIMQSDEGPYPDRYAADENNFDWKTATPDELETKYGILNAFYLPGDAPPGAPEPYPMITPWNTFQLLFDRYFGTSLPLLPDRSYTSSSYLRPYDLVDVTGRLPSLQGR